MIATTTPEAAAHVADNLGPDEICVKLYGKEKAASLAFEVAMVSPLSWCVFSADGEAVAMFGADGEKGDEYGSAWMFSTESVNKAARSLIQGAAFGIAISRDWWPELRIEAEPRSARQTKLLEHLGFKPRTVEVRDGETWTELVQ